MANALRWAYFLAITQPFVGNFDKILHGRPGDYYLSIVHYKFRC